MNISGAQSSRRRGCLAPVVASLLLTASSAPALEPVTVRSQSGQFVVTGLPLAAQSVRYTTSNVPYLRLDPTLTAVSLERIRQSILAELKLPDRWRGLITVKTFPVTEDDPAARITSVRYSDRWGYRLELPERMDRERFIRVGVKAILLEIANRTALVREAELPPWLAEGLATELETTTLATLALEPDTLVARRDQNPDVMRAARALLRHRPALKFDELNMPSEEQLLDETGLLYRACAHVLVHELLRLRHGRDCLREMLSRLPESLNWQTTFLKAFATHFPRLIDADKWYALHVATLSGREQMSVWPLETTDRQLGEILSTQVQVRLNAGELPIQTEVPLQRIIGEWEFSKQEPVLLQKLERLRALRQRAAPELTGLIDDYIQVLQDYTAGKTSVRTAGLFRLRSKASSVIEQLDTLDSRRQTLRDRPAKASPGP